MGHKELAATRCSRLQRSELLLGAAALERLRQSTVLVGGLGGTGGALAVTLARMGVGRLIIADPGVFDWPDANRQWAADASSIGRNKTEVYTELLERIAPDANIEAHPEGIQPDNVERLVAGADLICDNLDINVEMALRGRLLQLAREKGVYSTSCPIVGFGAFLAVASPAGMSMTDFLSRLGRATQQYRMPNIFREVYSPELIERMEQCMKRGTVPSLGVGPLISASLTTTEAMLILLEGTLDPWREPLILPQVLMIDLFQMSYVVTELDKL